jgi:Zn-dependent protease with chaperone function
MSDALFILRGMTLALAWLMAVNLVATLAIALGFRPLMAFAGVKPPGFWLGARLFPAAASIAFVAIVFLPSYWKYEPRELAEGFDLTLGALAVAALAMVVAAAVRGVSAARRATHRTQAWLRMARPVTLRDTSVPAFAIDTDAPAMALAGVACPRLLITRGVLDALTAEELSASVAHEIGHHRSWDNLKRLAMCAAPDMLTATAAARAIERQWASASEHAADRQACDTPRARCALASALVKVARLTPASTPITEPVSTLIDGGEIASRVRHLLDEDMPAAAPRRSPRRWIAVALPAAALVVGYAPALRAVHAVTEALVQTLP